MKLPISNLIVSRSIFIIIYIYIYHFFLFWVYLMIGNIVDFFWRYNISLISWKLSISYLIVSLAIFIYIYIYHFFCFECISWYELSSSSFGDIIFHWYHEIANLEFDRLSLSFFFYIYISLILILMYFMSRNIVFFFLAI